MILLRTVLFDGRRRRRLGRRDSSSGEEGGAADFSSEKTAPPLLCPLFAVVLLLATLFAVVVPAAPWPLSVAAEERRRQQRSGYSRRSAHKVVEPTTPEVRAEIQQSRNLDAHSYTVPVYFVALQPTPVGANTTEAQVEAMVAALNRGFERTPFAFEYKPSPSATGGGGIARVSNPDYSVCKYPDSFKTQYRQGGGAFDALTVYLCNTEYIQASQNRRNRDGSNGTTTGSDGSVWGLPLGSATFPENLTDTVDSWKVDGVTVLNPALLKTKYQFISGQALIHEVGHW